MIYVKLYCYSTGKEFVRKFDSPFIARKFILRAKYGKSLKYISTSADSAEELKEATRKL